MAQDIEVIQPTTAEELSAMFDVRYKMLDEPDGEPRQTELESADLGEGVDLFVAVRDGEVVGTARLTPGQTEGLFFIQSVATLYHGQGIGRALLQGIEKAAKARGATRLELFSSEEARGFYERLDYLSKYLGEVARKRWMAKDL